MIQVIQYSDTEQFHSMAKLEGMAGWSKDAEYWGWFDNGKLVATTSIQFYESKVKFNNHFVLKEYRGRGIFKRLFAISIKTAQRRGFKVIEAACTDMSLPYYLKIGAKIVRKYKICTSVRINL